MQGTNPAAESREAILRILDLSHVITPGMAQWPGDDQPLAIHLRSEHGDGTHMSSALELGCHVGTHIDAPLHFLAGQPGLDALPIEDFCGRGRLVRLPAGTAAGPLGPEILAGNDDSDTDFIIIATGWERYWGTPRYYREWPYLSGELAAELARRGLKGIGLDTPSLDDPRGRIAHDICAAAGMINIENLAGLARLPERPFTFLALPLKLAATEASPVRAVALVEET